jgi:IS5 family transposase
MRRAKDGQGTLEFQRGTLKLTRDHHERYRRIDVLLEEVPGILRRVHADVRGKLERLNRQRNRRCKYTTDSVLRLAICQVIEGASLREIVVRVDDSNFLRWFCRFGYEKMMSCTLFCSLRNSIRPETWKAINRVLAEHAVETAKITGGALRVDTTACETNIHYPTDSSLLWDVYRTFARLIDAAREIDPSLAANRRLHVKRAKRHYATIARAAGKNTKTKTLKPQYEALLGLVGRVLEIGDEVADGLRSRLELGAIGDGMSKAIHVLQQLGHYRELATRVVEQATRRVLGGEQVPNDEKIFSIFEPHTELLKRGKAGKPIEFGHMVLFAQTPEKFISDFDVYEKKPVEHKLVDVVLDWHKKLFGAAPGTLAADKGFYESVHKLEQLEKDIDVVAIGKKGKRSPEEDAREHSLAFKLGQAFRAGIEGTISFVKRSLRLYRCFNKGWKHYAATVGATVFAHNLLILVRGSG